MIKPNVRVPLPHQRSATVSVETNPPVEFTFGVHKKNSSFSLNYLDHKNYKNEEYILTCCNFNIETIAGTGSPGVVCVIKVDRKTFNVKS